MNFKFFFFLLGILILSFYTSSGQKYILLGNVNSYNPDFRSSTCLMSERIAHIEKDYSKRDKKKNTIHLIDSTLLNDFCNYIENNGKLLTYYRDGGPESIYQVIIQTDGTFQLYFEFYSKEEVAVFYKALIEYMNQKHGIKNKLSSILEIEKSKYSTQ